jgi:hypothetical protein
MKEVPDWTKAPEGATHAGQVRDGSVCWYMVVDGGGYFFSYQSDIYDFTSWEAGPCSRPMHEPLTQRPAPSWNGIGLPPVGVECNAVSTLVSCEHWGTVKVIAYHNEFAWLSFSNSSTPNCARLDSIVFSAIQTPEQIAADERDAAIEEIENMITGYSYKKCAEIIYEAGFRNK